MSSSGYSNAQQHFIGLHRGGGFQTLMQQGPNPYHAQRPQSMSPAHAGAQSMSLNSFGQQSDTPMMPSASGPEIRHGSGAQVQCSGTRSRMGSREKRRADESRGVSSTSVRSASCQMGPQETSKWDTVNVPKDRHWLTIVDMSAN